MNITEIDKNFKLTVVKEPDVKWLDIKNEPFIIKGVSYYENEKRYRRMPEEVANRVSVGVNLLSTNTSGGRVRFVTDSPFIALRAVIPAPGIMSHMPIVGTCGFSIYSNNNFIGMCTPDIITCSKENIVDNKVAFEGVKYPKSGKNLIEIYFPLYNGVCELFVGIKDGCILEKAPEYTHELPVLFYGSSITQGGCASRPGNDYISHLERWLDTDIYNLGFSGNAKAEQTMCDYIANQKVSTYVIDYDHNAPTVEHLENTHFNLYKTIREKNANTPIVFISKPDFDYDPFGVERRTIIFNTYNTALKNGDKNVYYIDGETLFGDEDRDACTVDTCHPNDLGFYRMAKNIYPTLKKLLK